MRITRRGQVTIPAAIRKEAGLLPNTEVEFRFDGSSVQIVRANTAHRSVSGAQLVTHLRKRGDVPMSTDEIMALTLGK